jgi:hypothetical protein
MLIVAILSTAYLAVALPGYLYYHFKSPLKNNNSSEIAALLIPLLLYFSLMIIEDRQGFNSVFASLFVGGLVSLAFILRCHWPAADRNFLFAPMMIAVAVAVWIFFPKTIIRII